MGATRLSLAVLAIAVCAGCPDATNVAGGDAALGDSTVQTDASGDAAQRDAFVPDSQSDGPVLDAALLDARQPEPDGGDLGPTPDMARPDLAQLDAAPTPDAAEPDVAQPDAALPDAAMPDAFVEPTLRLGWGRLTWAQQPGAQPPRPSPAASGDLRLRGGIRGR